MEGTSSAHLISRSRYQKVKVFVKLRSNPPISLLLWILPIRVCCWQQKHELNHTNPFFHLVMLKAAQFIGSVCSTYIYLLRKAVSFTNIKTQLYTL